MVVCPFFLGPGKHWTGDIPRLAAEAAAKHPGTTYHVTMPLGIDDLILQLIDKRIGHCVGSEFLCDNCRGSIRSGEPEIAAALLRGELPGAAPAAHGANGNGQAGVQSSRRSARPARTRRRSRRGRRWCQRG